MYSRRRSLASTGLVAEVPSILPGGLPPCAGSDDDLWMWEVAVHRPDTPLACATLSGLLIRDTFIRESCSLSGNRGTGSEPSSVPAKTHRQDTPPRLAMILASKRFRGSFGRRRSLNLTARP